MDKNLSEKMDQVRKLAEVGHSLRKNKGIKLRQPLNSFTYGKESEELPPELESILAQELNVKSVVFKSGKSLDFDFKITNKLSDEGQARDIVRNIQVKRKEAGCILDEYILVELPEWPKEYEEYIKNETLAKELKKGQVIMIKKVK